MCESFHVKFLYQCKLMNLTVLLNNMACVYQTWNNVEVSVFYNLENGLSSNFHLFQRKPEVDHGPVEALRKTKPTRVRLLRAEKRTSLHKSSLFPLSQQRLLEEREIWGERRLSGVLQIGHGKDRVFLPEKQMAWHVCRTLI